MFQRSSCINLIPLAAITLMTAALLAASPLGNELDGRIDAGLALLYQGQYDAALDTFRSFSAAHPDNPAGRFFAAIAYQLRGLAYESDAWDRHCEAMLDSARELSGRALARDPADSWAFFFRGGTYACQASRDARRGRLLAALNKGLSGMSDLKKAVAIDPGLHDAYLGLGTYHYFRTKSASIFKWLPFIGDRRDQGVAELRIAAAKGKYTSVMARNSLVWVLIDYGKFDQALAEARALEQQYPDNHAFHWGAADIHYRCGRWAAAAEAYERLLRLNQDAKPMNNYNRIFITARLAKCRYEQKHYGEAANLAKEAISLPLPEAAVRRLQPERARAQQVMKMSEQKARASRP